MTTLRFVGDLPFWLGCLLALIGAALAFAYYRRESHRLGNSLCWILPTLRSLAIFLALLVLTGPVLHHRHEEGRLGDVIVIVDGSASMAAKDDHMASERKADIVRGLHWLSAASEADSVDAMEGAVGRFDRSSRLDRVREMLFESDRGLVDQIKGQHHVRVGMIRNDELVLGWDSLNSDGENTGLNWSATGIKTNLGQGLTTATASDDPNQLGERSEKRTAVVLLSDGQNNSGVAPIQVARVLGSQNVAVHTVGMGDEAEPRDGAILDAEYPQKLFAKNRVRGRLRIKDRLPSGQQGELVIRHEQEILWQAPFVANNQGEREVEFDFSISELSEKLAVKSEDLKFQTLPLTLTAELIPASEDHEPSNNSLRMPLSVITQRYKVLIVDGRSRWETRYLKNAFQRDDAWNLTTVIPHDDGSMNQIPVGDSETTFPTDRAGLMAFDLVVIGDVPSRWFKPEQVRWLRELVELGGGGLIWVDGSRNHLRSYRDTPLEALLPVQWQEASFDPTGQRLKLTEVGGRLPTFVLDGNDQAANMQFWEKLPSPKWSAVVEALPGSEVLAETDSGNRRLPAIVRQRFGAGNVMYFAFDETWRWRYQVADTYHQRFWNQIARLVMRRPMAVSDDYVALDSGEAQYNIGDSAELRVRLTDATGRGVANSVVEAILLREGTPVATVLLNADEQNPGTYLGETAPLPAGEFEVAVRASGYPASAMKARTRLTVIERDRDELLRLACDRERLTQIAKESGASIP